MAAITGCSMARRATVSAWKPSIRVRIPASSRRADEQQILFSHNVADDLFVPEEITIPWSEGVCSFVHDGRAPEYTDNVPRDIPDSTVARMLGYRSFLSLPVFRRGQFYGTLCG